MSSTRCWKRVEKMDVHFGGVQGLDEGQWTQIAARAIPVR